MEKAISSKISDNSNSAISVSGEGNMDISNGVVASSQEKMEASATVVNKKQRRQGLMDITELSPELLSAYKIVTQLMSVSNKNVNFAFMNPINYSDPENANYTEVIKKPMWLNKVKLKLLSGRYTSISQVVRDLRLVLENCYRFYGPAHTITKKAIKLETMLEQKLALLPRELKEKTSLQLTTPELVNKVEDKAKASSSKTAPKIASHKEETSMILNCVRQARAKQEREARRLQMEEKRAERDATNQELIQWEETFYGNELITVKKMWEVPQIGHFLYLVQTVLNIPEVSQFELERAFLKPQSSSLLASIMTSLLSSPHQRAKLDEIPAMTYKIWQSRLKLKVQSWYKVFNHREKAPLKVFETSGVEPMFFSVMGHENPLETSEFHELNLKQRVWLVKSMCDHCLQNHKTIQEAIMESSPLDQREYALGKDREETTYIHFPQFCGQSLRVYKQYFDTSQPPDFEFPLLISEETQIKEEVVENNVEEAVKEEKVDKVKVKKEETKIEDEKEESSTPGTTKKRKGRKSTSWSSRRRRTRKKVVEEEPEPEEEEPLEEIKPKIIPFFELVVDNIESLRQLTDKFSYGKETRESKETMKEESSIPPSAPDTPSSSRASPSPSPSPIPDELLLATPNSRSTRRSKLLANLALKKASESPEVKRKREKETKKEPEAEEVEEEVTLQNPDEKNLHKRLSNLLKELEPWEQKLDLADRKIRFKLKKEWEDYQMKGTSTDAEAANEYWGAHTIDEFASLNASNLEQEESSSSDESFYINAEKELAAANQGPLDDAGQAVDETVVGDGSQFRKTHYRRCTKRKRVDRNVVTGPISSSEEQEEEEASDESSGSTSSFHISVSSRGRIRKTKKIGFNFEGNHNEIEQKTTLLNNKDQTTKETIVISRPNGIVLDTKKRDLDNAKSQYQWETMRQLIVDNSTHKQQTPLVPRLKIFKTKPETATNISEGATGQESTSSPQQPILENLLASQPGFGEMKVAPKSASLSQPVTLLGEKLPAEPKYLQSFIQKHYQPPTQPKSLSYFRKDTNAETSTNKTVVIRQSKDGGRKVIETTFSKPGIMKTTVSTTNQEVTTPNKAAINPRPRQPCYANANSPATTTVAASKVATSVSFVTQVYKPGQTQTDSTTTLSAPQISTQVRVVPQSQVQNSTRPTTQVVYTQQVGNQRVIYRPQQGVAQQGYRGVQPAQRPQAAQSTQQVVYRAQQGNPRPQVNQRNPGPQQVVYRQQQPGNPIPQQGSVSTPQQVIQRPQQTNPRQGTPRPQKVVQRTQQIIYRLPQGNMGPTYTLPAPSPQQANYRPQQTNPGSSQVKTVQQRVVAPQRPRYSVAEAQINHQNHQYAGQGAQQQVNANQLGQQQMMQQGNYNPQVNQDANYNNQAAQQTTYQTLGSQQVNYQPPASQQVFNPQSAQQGNFQTPVNYHQGTYPPNAPQQVNYQQPQSPQTPQQPNYPAAVPQQVNYQTQSPQAPQQVNYQPQTPQQATYSPQVSYHPPAAPQQVNYHPQATQHANYNPQTNYNTQQTNYTAPAQQGTTYNSANFNATAQQGNYHPQATYHGQPPSFNHETQGNYTIQTPTQSQQVTQQEYAPPQQTMAASQNGTIPANIVAPQQVANVTQGSVVSQASGSGGPRNNSPTTTRRVLLMPIKGNLPTGQRFPIVLKVVSRNSSSTSNVQTISNASGNVTFAKLVKSSNPGTSSFVIKEQASGNVVGESRQASVFQNPPNEMASPAANTFLNQTLYQTNQNNQQYFQANSTVVQYSNPDNQQMTINQMNPSVVTGNGNTTLTVLNNVPNLGTQTQQTLINQHHQMLSNNEAISNVVVQCPVQMQTTANPAQYVTTPTTPAPPNPQTNERVLVCSPNSTFESDRSSENVYFLTNSGQLVAFNKNNQQNASSVSHPTLMNDSLTNL